MVIAGGGGPGGVLHDLFAGSVQRGFDDGLLAASWRAVAERAAEILVTGAVLEVNEGAPNEVSGEAAQQHHNEFGQAAPEDGCPGRPRGLANRVAGGKRKGETGAHDAGEGRDKIGRESC